MKLFRRAAWVLAGMVVAAFVSARPAAACGTTAAPLLPVNEVTLFKDGHAFVLQSGRVATNEAGDVTLDRSERIDTALRAIAQRHGARFVALPLEWYGVDPVHVRAAAWMTAWRTIAGFDGADARVRAWETLRLFMMKPERRSWLGVPQRGRQPGLTLAGGVSVAAY